mgnify:CR=1 FL=1
MPGDEPFTRYFSQGQILGPDGRRMSKSQANRRKKLKAIMMDKKLPLEDRFAASLKPAQLPLVTLVHYVDKHLLIKLRLMHWLTYKHNN